MPGAATFPDRLELRPPVLCEIHETVDILKKNKRVLECCRNQADARLVGVGHMICDVI